MGLPKYGIDEGAAKTAEKAEKAEKADLRGRVRNMLSETRKREENLRSMARAVRDRLFPPNPPDVAIPKKPEDGPAPTCLEDILIGDFCDLRETQLGTMEVLNEILRRL